MVESNNAINNTVGASITGVTNTLTVTNASDTASSVARATITVGGASAGDPTLNFNVSGVTDWEMGIDNGSSDLLKISQGTALGTNDTWIMTTAGERTMPLQPSFRAFLSADQLAVTGDGTTVSITFDSTDYNIGSVYSTGTGLFTAPVDGTYFFNIRLRLNGLSAAHTNVTMTCVDPIFRANAATMRNNGNAIGITGSTVTQLTALDTVQPQVVVNNGAKTVNLDNINNINCVFTGYLIQ